MKKSDYISLLVTTWQFVFTDNTTLFSSLTTTSDSKAMQLPVTQNISEIDSGTSNPLQGKQTH